MALGALSLVRPESSRHSRRVLPGYTGCMTLLRYDISFWNADSYPSFKAGNSSKFHEVTIDGTDDFGDVLERASEGSFPAAHGLRPRPGDSLIVDGTELGIIITADVREADDDEAAAAVSAAMELLGLGDDIIDP